MKYTKKNNHIVADNGKVLYVKGDLGIYNGEQYTLPYIFTDVYLANGMTKEQALEFYEETTLEELETHQDELKAQLDAQIAQENPIPEAEIIEEVE